MECIIYGGNSKLIYKTINYLEEKFDHIYILSRKYSGKKTKKMTVINYGFTANLHSKLEEINFKTKKIYFISAAAYSTNNLFLNETEKSISEILEANIINNLIITQNILKRTIKNNFGKFIYISSFRADYPTNGTVLYSATKKTTEKLFEALTLEYSKFNQKFITLKIGLFEDGLSKNLPFDIKSKEFIKKNIANGRVSNTDDIIAALNFIIDSDYINGCELDLTGKFKFDIR